jgi:histidinol-phosphatase (PHP family)
MYQKQNLHTHSTFCDGKDTPEEMIQEALKSGFDSLGFSMHSYLSCSNYAIVTREKVVAYRQEISRLKEKYRGIIDIFLGLEQDVLSEDAAVGYDYTIGSVHYLHTKNGKKGFDVGLEGTLAYIDAHYDGDAMKFAKAYYEMAATIPDHGDFDIIGHFDILTKNNELGKFLDVDSKEYLGYALDAMDALKGRMSVFEVNTGAISRGYRTTPYPQMALLKAFRQKGFGVVITSDCHDKNYLDCYFEESKMLLREAGFRSQLVFTSQGFQEVAL